jgi:hypothetical protein
MPPVPDSMQAAAGGSTLPLHSRMMMMMMMMMLMTTLPCLCSGCFCRGEGGDSGGEDRAPCQGDQSRDQAC